MNKWLKEAWGMGIRNTYGQLRRKLIGADRAIPTPQGIDWKPFYEFNQKLIARGQEPISNEDWLEALKPQPAPQHMTREQIGYLQQNLYRNNRAPLSAREIAELRGLTMSDIKTDFQVIESNYQATLQRADAEIAHLAELGFQIPPDARAKAKAQADAERDRAIAEQRDLVFNAAAMLRESHAQLAYQAKLNATLAVSPDKAQQMGALVAGCRNVEALERLHAQALKAGDEAGAFYIEQNGAQALAAIPGRVDENLDFEAARMNTLADQNRTRRAGEPYRKIQDGEAELAEAMTEVNSHLTSFEATATAQTLGGFKDTAQFQSGAPIAGLRLPAAEPVFD